MKKTAELLNELFQEWQQRGNFKVIKDGVHYRHPNVDKRYDTWHHANPRVLFIAKEMHGDTGDIAENWSSSKFYVDKYAVCQYLYMNGVQGKQLEEIAVTAEAIKAFFNGNPYCWINVKKTAGKSTANNNEIAEHLHKYGDLLIKEVEILKPTHVVCLCGANNGAVVEKLKSLGSQPALYTAYHPAAFLRSRKAKYRSLRKV